MAEAETTRSAGAILLKDLELFNSTSVYFERDVNTEVLGELGQAMEAWCVEKHWETENLDAEQFGNVTWCAPPLWKSGEEDGYVAWFDFGYPSDLTGNSYHLANLCGVGEDRVGFSFQVDHASFGGKSAWNSSIKSPEASMFLEQLSRSGFSHLGKGVYFLPVAISIDEIAQAWEAEDYADATKPLTAALDLIAVTLPAFQSLLDAAKQ